MSERAWKRGAIICGVIIVLLAIVGQTAGGANSNDSSKRNNSKTATPGDEVSLTAKQKDKLKQNLTVRKGDILPKQAKCVNDVFLRNSLAPVQNGDPAARQWSDAMSTPFGTEDPNLMAFSLLIEHCGNPTELDNTIQGLSSQTIDGINIGANNPWMGEFERKANDVGLRRAYLTKKTGDEDGVYVTADYQLYAAMTNTLLLNFQRLPQTAKLASVSNWHQSPKSQQPGELPRAALNGQQEDHPVLVFQYTVKAGCPLVQFGFNVKDKRFENLPVPMCAPPPAPAPAPQPTPTQPGGGTSPTTKPHKPPPTTRPTTPPTTRPPKCPSGKCTPPKTLAPPPTTAPPSGGTSPTTSGGGNSGPGAPPNGGTTPPTTAPPVTDSTPTTTPPTTRAEY